MSDSIPKNLPPDFSRKLAHMSSSWNTRLLFLRKNVTADLSRDSETHPDRLARERLEKKLQKELKRIELMEREVEIGRQKHADLIKAFSELKQDTAQEVAALADKNLELEAKVREREAKASAMMEDVRKLNEAHLEAQKEMEARLRQLLDENVKLEKRCSSQREQIIQLERKLKVAEENAARAKPVAEPAPQAEVSAAVPLEPSLQSIPDVLVSSTPRASLWRRVADWWSEPVAVLGRSRPPD